MIRQLLRDMAQLTKASRSESWRRAIVLDSFSVTAITRAREAIRRSRVPFLNRALRLAQTMIYGIDIGSQVQLGDGVYFVHPLGTVIGGTARVGDRVKFMGCNTVGTAKDNGYPVIENDVIVGSGARILGPVRVGAGAVIGANSVVLCDVPPGAVAVGIPARVRHADELREADLNLTESILDGPRKTSPGGGRARRAQGRL
jgi:serine O-acetyltransferase